MVMTQDSSSGSGGTALTEARGMFG